jgi:hypothetical protein
MKTRLFLLSAALLMAGISAYGQSGPSVTLTVSSNAPGTATILRATGACPASGVPSSGTTLTSTLAVPTVGAGVTFSDNPPSAGNWCYWATLAATGGGSGVSNTFLGSFPIVVTLSGK